jgi:hypothetical protein
MRIRELGAERPQLAAQPRQRSAGCKPADHLELLVVAISLPIGTKRNPRVGAAREIERVREVLSRYGRPALTSMRPGR